MSEKEKLKIKIFDKEYSLLVDDKNIAVELAEYVNDVIEETRNELEGQSSETIAVIAALNIAHDLFIERSEFKEFGIQAVDRIKKIKLLLSDSENLSVPS